MKFLEFIEFEKIEAQVEISSKKKLFEKLAKLATLYTLSEDEENTQKSTDLYDADEIKERYEEVVQIYFDALNNREKLGNTSLGLGIAMPHAKIEDGEKIRAFFLQLKTPVDYDSLDNRDVDLVLCLFIPKNSCDKCAQKLPLLAQKLINKALLKKLRASENNYQIMTALKDFELEIINFFELNEDGINNNNS